MTKPKIYVNVLVPKNYLEMSFIMKVKLRIVTLLGFPIVYYAQINLTNFSKESETINITKESIDNWLESKEIL